ncbi:MAG: CmpA/NrtA family ABC transporter substrate-binding protein [Undibacterium umbellatum]|jgi:nitrate/nitrite transport system substrate-binding protein|uniref:ABC transporter substrate-binding protein n=2 Tax=Oxalobacteraceae TaxID=75682 RepID=A0ABR6Z622_9BURK|nr:MULTISPECIES: CmpA/NrtA family ABC transporter substrate-binding protein [Undibacterium]MBC3907190.1 ABC transporter substrate-binding protein [Undibacterium umbellatum]MDP1980657.1 CmpA/NrtA family ABC transporter substrate-binding protein [Undibacterium sp.]
MSNQETSINLSKTQEENEPNFKRRSFLQTAALASGAGIMGLSTGGVWAAGSDKPEKEEVHIGFIPLTDCASVVMASVLGFDKKYGIKIIPSKESSWASVRDKLVNGELDAAHVLYGLIYGVQLGVGGNKKDMAVLMTLNNNGQAITLSKKLADKGAVDGAGLAKLMQTDKREYTFAQTFPTGTHAMWLYYWLAAHGINPMKDAKVITVPPPQMVANMRVGNMDGYCVGEPWNHRAIADGIGITAATTQDIWKDHPEKVLGTTSEFVQKYPNTARAVVAAILDASRWIDASLSNKSKMAETIADKSYVNTSVDVINQRILGRYQNGLGKTWDDPNYMKFFNDGAVNFPYLSDGMWFLTQHRRWGLLKADPDYLAVAKAVNRIDVYKDAATMAKVSVPKDPMRSSKFMDGTVWDGKNPAAYAASFKIKA